MVNTSQLAPPVTAKAPGRQGAVLAVLSIAAFMASLDLFIVNVAFDDIGRDFSSASLADLSWVLNGYAIVYAALLIPLGRLADRYSRKAGFLLGLGVFTFASALCALSPGLWWLVAARALQAAGAAALTPTSLGLLIAATPAAKRVRAVRIWAVSGSLAAAAGPAIGGILVSASWRWAFVINLPIGIVALVIAYRIVPDSRDTSVTRLPDAVGAGILTAAIASLSLGIIKSPEWGWGSAGTLSCLAIAVIGVAAFWWRSTTHHTPIVEPALLAVRAFAFSNLTALVFSMAFAIGLLIEILWLQRVWDYSALRTGLAIAPGPAMVPLFAILGQRFGAAFPAGRLAAIGCGLFAIGAILIGLSVGPDPSYLTEILPGWLIGGAGVGFALPTILSSATADLPQSRAATGSAVVNMSRQVGTVLGVSLLVAIIGTPITYSAVHSNFQHAWWVMAALNIVAGVLALGMTPKGVSPSAA
jgi:EmrB/QacA subfamily drug resistance transporter